MTYEAGDLAGDDRAMERIGPGSGGARLRTLACLRDHARITSHLAAGPCGARTLACRVDTHVDARGNGAKKRREESRRGTQECVSHGLVCEVIFAPLLSASPYAVLPLTCCRPESRHVAAREREPRSKVR